jgi:hypothetical protein
MTAYVQAYGEKASVVVATERYMQHVTGRGRSEPEDRLTVADFGIVKAQALGGWVGFRDVLEADGARIADHTDRLFKVLSDVSGRLDEARRLSDESARYNIGPVSRNFNVPTTALFFFSPENIERFKFTGKRVERDGICEITFQETRRPTLIKTPEGRSVPSEGSVWINASDGTVLRTFIRIKGFGRGSAAVTRDSGTAQVEVSYTRVPTLNMWLPEVMVESYETGRGPLLERTTAEARYSKYRVFQTSGRIK